MDSSSKFWLGVWLIAGATVLGIGGLISFSHLKSNEMIKEAKTCEAAVIIQGGAQTELRLMICALGNKLKEANQ